MDNKTGYKIIGIVIIISFLAMPTIVLGVGEFLVMGISINHNPLLQEKVFNLGKEAVKLFIPKEKNTEPTMIKVKPKPKLIQPIQKIRLIPPRYRLKVQEELGYVEKKTRKAPWNAFVFFNKTG